MTFEDLPSDWATRPVTDPDITADLLDLLIQDSDRRGGAVAVLVCGPGRRLVQPVVVSLPPEGVEPGEHRRVFDVVCQGISRARGEGSGGSRSGGIVVAVARPSPDGPARVTGDDRQWSDAARRSAQDHGVELWGAWVVTPRGIRQIETPAELLTPAPGA